MNALVSIVIPVYNKMGNIFGPLTDLVCLISKLQNSEADKKP